MDASTFLAHRRVLRTPAGEIAYTELGDGPAALFVHGIGTSGLLWRHVIGDLRDTTRCIAIDLPMHGGTPSREDLSATALTQVVADLCDGLGLTQVDLVGNDTGGALAQLFAARRPDRIRSLVLTNCDCEGNFPPPEFAPIVTAARQGQLADLLTALAGRRNHRAGAGLRAADRRPRPRANGRGRRAAARARRAHPACLGHRRGGVRAQVGVLPARHDSRGAGGHRGGGREALLPRGAPRGPTSRTCAATGDADAAVPRARWRACKIVMSP